MVALVKRSGYGLCMDAYGRSGFESLFQGNPCLLTAFSHSEVTRTFLYILEVPLPGTLSIAYLEYTNPSQQPNGSGYFTDFKFIHYLLGGRAQHAIV